MALPRMYGSTTCSMFSADCTRETMPGLAHRIVQRQTIHHRRQHAHVVGLWRDPCPCRRRNTAKDVATADDHADLTPRSTTALDFGNDARQIVCRLMP
jgi:hypothetical protein